MGIYVLHEISAEAGSVLAQAKDADEAEFRALTRRIGSLVVEAYSYGQRVQKALDDLDALKVEPDAPEKPMQICRTCKLATCEGRGDWMCGVTGDFTGDFDTCEEWEPCD